MANKLHLQIVTANGLVCEEYADFVLVPIKGGDEGILPDHAAMIAALSHGVLRYKTENEERYLAILGGVMSLADNELIILAVRAERAENIDLARAQASEKRARARIEAKAANLDMSRAELSLHRSLARQKAYSYLHK